MEHTHYTFTKGSVGACVGACVGDVVGYRCRGVQVSGAGFTLANKGVKG